MTKHPARQKRTKQVIGRVRTADNPSIFSKLLMEVSSCTETMPSRQVTGQLMSISDAELSDVQRGRLICGVYANTG
jgi:hypothetical protein